MAIMNSNKQSILAERLNQVEQRIVAACRRAGRARNEVTLVAVTKSVDIEIAELLPELGVLHLGESRPQELWKKAAALPKSIHWHLVGHLQRNKIERTLKLVQLIHSIDSLRLLEALEQECVNREVRARILLEINVSHEEAKHGFPPEDLTKLANAIYKFPNLEIAGLMTMAALTGSAEDARPTFAELRHLRDQIRQLLGQPNALLELSMGMTNDFEIAIEEGATLVRIGSAIFDGLSEPAS